MHGSDPDSDDWFERHAPGALTRREAAFLRARRTLWLEWGASGALGLAYVAAGRSDGYAEVHMNAWDCLAGLLLVQEAGARTGPFLAHGTLAAGGPVIAAAPGIADGFAAATGLALEA